jgi:hypothetical protein
MAPIPLTLLGIIPAHFVFFQMGWGGEFTATSMIGWIALAGIIVRNSILLVDFSIHQIQRGTTVVESVILACKTRTRPIMITALALVCGSSVIFFDPIFQGMAISLASGVLVSTVLTLIVIPLGCISAKQDLLEVAAATAPEASRLGEFGAAPDDSAPISPQKPEAVPSDAQHASLPERVWGRLVGLVTLLFYLFRGLFLLLFQRLSRLFKSGAGTKIDEVIPPSGRGGSSDASGGAPPAGDLNGDLTHTPSSMAAKPAADAPPVSDVEGNDSPAVAAESPSAAGRANLKSDQVEASATSKGRQPAAKKKAVARSKKRPSTLKKQAAKKKVAASPKRSTTSSPAKPKQTVLSGNNGGQPADKQHDEVAEKRRVASNVSPFPVRKRSPRRGIRLK